LDGEGKFIDAQVRNAQVAGEFIGGAGEVIDDDTEDVLPTFVGRTMQQEPNVGFHI
jgi:hypothetical protein